MLTIYMNLQSYKEVSAFVDLLLIKSTYNRSALSQLETRLRTIGVQLKDSISIDDKRTFESGFSFNGGRFNKDTTAVVI